MTNKDKSRPGGGPGKGKGPIKVVKNVRTPFGTRVMKTIVCARCGESDTISFVPKDGRPLLCRRCAEKELDVIQEGRGAERIVACEVCGADVIVAKRKPWPSAPRSWRDDEAPQKPLDPLEGRVLCDAHRKAALAERRQGAKKPAGVHPLLVKRKGETR